MSTFTAKDVQALRHRTGMGMAECKKALDEAQGDADKAIQILQENAKGKMATRADRTAGEGSLAIAAGPDAVAMIELASETDFTAKNDAFIAAADAIAKLALEQPVGSITITDAITQQVDSVRLTTKENISFRRGVKVAAPFGKYLHHNRKVAAVVAFAGTIDADLATGLAQHVSAIDGLMLPVPLAIDEQGLPASDVAAAKAGFITEAQATGKGAEVAEKIATGKMRKWLDERTLLGQAYVKDMTGKTTVAAALGKSAKVIAYHRYTVGG